MLEVSDRWCRGRDIFWWPRLPGRCKAVGQSQSQNFIRARLT